MLPEILCLLKPQRIATLSSNGACRRFCRLQSLFMLSNYFPPFSHCLFIFVFLGESAPCPCMHADCRGVPGNVGPFVPRQRKMCQIRPSHSLTLKFHLFGKRVSSQILVRVALCVSQVKNLRVNDTLKYHNRYICHIRSSKKTIHS